MADDTCRAYDVDGETVSIHGGEPLTEAGRAALGEIVRAATAKVEAEHPNLGVIQELIMAGLAATRAIPDGEVRGGCTIQDGAKVKARLKAAIQAARVALQGDQSVGPEARCMNGPAKQHTLRMVEMIKALKAASADGALPGELDDRASFAQLARAIVDHWPAREVAP